MLKLFYFPGACSLAAHIVLEEIGEPYERQLVNLRDGQQRSPEYLRTNPKGKVPALLTERGVLTENPVILGYLARRYPAAQLAPLGDDFDFAVVQAFNTYLATTLHPLYGRVNFPARFVEGEEAGASLRAKAAQAIDDCFRLIEQRFSDDRPYVHGSQYTISDPYLYVFERWTSRPGAAGLSRHPHVQAHHDRLQARAAVQRALAAEELS